jgi:hypothetical protein
VLRVLLPAVFGALDVAWREGEDARLVRVVRGLLLACGEVGGRAELVFGTGGVVLCVLPGSGDWHASMSAVL